MSRSRKVFFSWAYLSGFDSVAPARKVETSLRSQTGVVLWFPTAAAQRVRESQSQLQSHSSL